MDFCAQALKPILGKSPEVTCLRSVPRSAPLIPSASVPSMSFSDPLLPSAAPKHYISESATMCGGVPPLSFGLAASSPVAAAPQPGYSSGFHK